MSDQKKLSAEKYLQQLETLDTNINQNLERLADMQINMCNVGGIDYSAALFVIKMIERRCCYGKKRQIN